MTDHPEKPDELEQISRLIDRLSAEVPNGTAWVFAALVQIGDSKLGAMLCTNQDTDEQTQNLFDEALAIRAQPGAVEETHRRGTMQ